MRIRQAPIGSAAQAGVALEDPQRLGVEPALERRERGGILSRECGGAFDRARQQGGLRDGLVGDAGRVGLRASDSGARS